MAIGKLRDFRSQKPQRKPASSDCARKPDWIHGKPKSAAIRNKNSNHGGDKIAATRKDQRPKVLHACGIEKEIRTTWDVHALARICLVFGPDLFTAFRVRVRELRATFAIAGRVGMVTSLRPTMLALSHEHVLFPRRPVSK